MKKWKKEENIIFYGKYKTLLPYVCRNFYIVTYYKLKNKKAMFETSVSDPDLFSRIQKDRIQTKRTRFETDLTNRKVLAIFKKIKT